MLKLFVTSLIVFISFQKGISQIDNRAEALNDYYENYIPSSFKSNELGWTGNVDNCVAGTISTIVQNKLLQRINYFRRMIGVEDQIIFDPLLNNKCQQAALIMEANDDLSHNPPSTWLCYNQVGYEAAGKSNLGLSSIDFYNPIDGYIEDPGESNYFVGHRRFIFHSKAKIFGVGQTTNTNALWVHQLSSNPVNSIYNKFIAYPPAGYIPNSLVFDRWSFGIPDANFSGASVTVNNTPVPIHSIEEGYADNTIVWEPSAINRSNSEDVFYNVQIRDVVLADGSSKNYDYTIIIFDPIIVGDVDGDGVRTINDAYNVAAYAVGTKTDIDCAYVKTDPNKICAAAADINRDGEINILDAYQISRCAVNLPDAHCNN